MFNRKSVRDIEMNDNSHTPTSNTEKKRKEGAEIQHHQSTKLKKHKVKKETEQTPNSEKDEFHSSIYNDVTSQPELLAGYKATNSNINCNDDVGSNVSYPMIGPFENYYPYQTQMPMPMNSSLSSESLINYNYNPEVDTNFLGHIRSNLDAKQYPIQEMPFEADVTDSSQLAWQSSNKIIEEKNQEDQKVRRRKSFYYPPISTSENTSVTTPPVKRNSHEFEAVEGLLSNRRGSFSYDTPRRKSIECEDAPEIEKLIEQSIKRKDSYSPDDNTSNNNNENISDKMVRMSQSESALSLPNSTTPFTKPMPTPEIPLAGTITLNENSATFTTDVISQYEKVLVEEFNYTQLIHFTMPEDHPLMQNPNMKPINDKGEEVNGVATFANAVGHHVGGKMSARLFAKNNSYYLLFLRNLFTASEKERTMEKIKKDLQQEDFFREIRDGVLIVLIALVRNPNGQLELQLRVIPNAEGFGHPGLVFKNEGREPLCVILAGELYILDGVIILVNDKSGNFSRQIAPRGINRKEVFDFMLKNNYSEKYKQDCYHAASEDNTVIVHEVLRRGFPHSLIRPKDLRLAFPIENLPDEIKIIAISAEKNYQLRLAKYKRKPLNRFTSTTTTTTTKITQSSSESVNTVEPILSDASNTTDIQTENNKTPISEQPNSSDKTTVTQNVSNFFTHAEEQKDNSNSVMDKKQTGPQI